MPVSSRTWPARALPSTNQLWRRSVTSCVRLASTRNGKVNTATRLGSCWKNRSGSSPDFLASVPVLTFAKKDSRKCRSECQIHRTSRGVMVEITEVTVEQVVVTSLSPRRASLAASIESWLGMLVEIPAAILVVAEIVILFAGVVARYGLHQPLIWSDELASILFLWLAMLGAAVAFRRSEHMRMTAVLSNASPPMRAYLDVVATCAALAFLIMIVWPAWDYAYEESYITTPALQISNSWRAAALPIGTVLMALFACLRLARVGNI